MTNALDIVRHRVRSDLLMGSRLPEFARFLDAVLAAGYTVVPIDRAIGPVSRTGDGDGTPRAGPAPTGLGRTLVLRHDVDTDPTTALEMLALERSRGIHGSWFVRWRTARAQLLEALADGPESVGYHYEELAALAKARRARSSDAALRLVPLARRRFLAHVRGLRRRTGLPFDLAASHGDFANRRLGVTNRPILDDRGFRREAGIRLEAYDEIAKSEITSEFSDTAPPESWVQVSGRPTDEGPLGAIGRGDAVVYVLVHPRHWRAAPTENLGDDARRLVEDLAWRLPSASEIRGLAIRRLHLPVARVQDRVARTRAVLTAPRVQITLDGGPDVVALHRTLTRRHRRFRMTQAKRWGVALMRVPLDPDVWLRKHRAVRRNERRALEAGYRATIVRAGDRLAEIAEITRSAPIRQGRPMPPEQLSTAGLTDAFDPAEPLVGVLDPAGRLCAFATGIAAGEAHVLSWLIGRADALDDGVMYLLMAEIVRSCSADRRATGRPTWLMADTFWGAGPGLAYFKERSGFRPYTVDWRLGGTTPSETGTVAGAALRQPAGG